MDEIAFKFASRSALELVALFSAKRRGYIAEEKFCHLYSHVKPAGNDMSINSLND